MRAVDRILPPYTRRLPTTGHKLRRLIIVAVMIGVAVMMGGMVALFPVGLMIYPALPILLLFPLVLWTMPDGDRDFGRAIAFLWFAYMAVAIAWPRYIAVDLPGLPWITPERLGMIALLVTTLFGLATSKRLRDDVWTALSAMDLLKKLFLAFVVCQIIVLPLSPRFGHSFQTLALDMFAWTFMTFVAAYVLSRPGNAVRFWHLFLFATFWVVMWVPLEVSMGKPPWAEYIPSFLSVDPELMATFLGSQARSSDGLYRARSVFTVSLVMTEYLAFAVPFILHMFFSERPRWQKALTFVLYVMLIYAVLASNARSGMAGLLLAHFVYPGLYALRRQLMKGKDNDLVAPSLLALYPVVAGAGVLIIFTSQRAYNRVFGHSGNQASNDGRERQYDNLWRELPQWPFGYGSGNAAQKVGVFGSGDKLTIDAYPLNLLMDYGVQGFLVFVAMFFTAIYLGIRTFLHARGEEEELAGPAAVAVGAFLLIKTVLSTDTNHYVAFVMLGLIFAMALRQQQRLAREAPAPAAARAVRPAIRIGASARA